LPATHHQCPVCEPALSACQHETGTLDQTRRHRAKLDGKPNTTPGKSSEHRCLALLPEYQVSGMWHPGRMTAAPFNAETDSVCVVGCSLPSLCGSCSRQSPAICDRTLHPPFSLERNHEPATPGLFIHSLSAQLDDKLRTARHASGVTTGTCKPQSPGLAARRLILQPHKQDSRRTSWLRRPFETPSTRSGGLAATMFL
jgi:hypothetical protein